MTPQEFAAAIAFGYEQRGVEFKGPGARTDANFVAKVVRAVLGMANRRDGGHVIIGVDETAGVPAPVGLTDTLLATWGYDDVADHFAKWADPGLSFDRIIVEDNQARRFVVLRVYEFADVPVLCRHPFNDSTSGKVVLRQGACYVRRRTGRIETSEIPTHIEMRELLDLATDKKLREFVARARAADLDLGPRRPTDADLFTSQLEEMWKS